jgi:hypothetical protein
MNNSLEAYKLYKKNNDYLAEQEQKKLNEAANKRDAFMHNYSKIRENSIIKSNERSSILEAARNDALSTVLKAIYITALEAGTLTDDGIILAEAIVDDYITSKGGASKIFNETAYKTYLLDRIKDIVCEAAEEETKETENIDKEEVPNEPETASDKEAEKQDLMDKIKELLSTADKGEIKDFIAQVKATGDEAKADADAEQARDKADAANAEAEDKEAKAEEIKRANGSETEDSGDSSEGEEAPQEDENDGKSAEAGEPANDDDDEEDPLDDTNDEEKDDDKSGESDNGGKGEAPQEDGDKDQDDEPEDTEDSDDDEPEDDDMSDDLGEPLDSDGQDSDDNLDGQPTTGDEPQGSKSKIFDDLDKEEDVKKAIDLIRQRVADAEETFIKNNAEDKKQIDQLIDKISTSVKTVEDLNDKDNPESKVAQEHARMYRNQINYIQNEKPHTIYEMFVERAAKDIVKDPVIRESYIDESGSVDFGRILETAKIRYGFAETLNTLQLESVDSGYIKNIIK